jgi:hypothetical protein
MDGWMDGWMDGLGGCKRGFIDCLRNQKSIFSSKYVTELPHKHLEMTACS